MDLPEEHLIYPCPKCGRLLIKFVHNARFFCKDCGKQYEREEVMNERLEKWLE